MKLLLTMFPTVVLGVYGQLMTKWRLVQIAQDVQLSVSKWERIILYLRDPYILSSYLAALAGSIAWIFVAERYAISIAFPIYVGLTVLLVVIGGAVFFNERMTMLRILAILLIALGVAIGTQTSS